MKTLAPKHDEPSLAEAIELINASDYRLTRPRKALLEKILKTKGPFSAPSLIKQLGGKNGCDPVTIWRTLPVFETLGIIEKCDFSEGMNEYEVVLGHKGHHHHHIVCTSCKKVEPLDFCIIQSQEQLLQKLGYTQLHHRLEFTALCPRCSK